MGKNLEETSWSIYKFLMWGSFGIMLVVICVFIAFIFALAIN